MRQGERDRQAPAGNGRGSVRARGVGYAVPSRAGALTGHGGRRRAAVPASRVCGCLLIGHPECLRPPGFQGWRASGIHMIRAVRARTISWKRTVRPGIHGLGKDKRSHMTPHTKLGIVGVIVALILLGFTSAWLALLVMVLAIAIPTMAWLMLDPSQRRRYRELRRRQRQIRSRWEGQQRQDFPTKPVSQSTDLGGAHHSVKPRVHSRKTVSPASGMRNRSIRLVACRLQGSAVRAH